MKKIVFQFSLILLIIMIGTMSIFITTCNASSKAKLSCPSSVVLGNDIKVALEFPSNTYMGSAKVTIKFSNGKSVSDNIVYQKGNAGFVNYVVLSTKTAAAGQASISVSEIKIGEESGKRVEENGSLSATVTISNPSTTPATDNPTTPSGGSTGNSGSTNNGGSSNGSSSSNNGGSTTTTNNSSQAKYTEVNETVVITASDVNFRKEASAKSGTYGLLQTGTKLTRTAIGDNGWSKVTYNGKTGYVSSQYLRKESDNNTNDNKEVKFKDVNETMYATTNCNLRKSWSTDSEKVGSLEKGQEVTRTGVADNGWSRIKYNGQVVYIATRLITNKKPDENTNEVNNEVTNEVTNELTKEQKLAAIQDEVGVLPEVGNNIANNLYIIITVIATTLVSVGIYFYIKKSE